MTPAISTADPPADQSMAVGDEGGLALNETGCAGGCISPGVPGSKLGESVCGMATRICGALQLAQKAVPSCTPAPHLWQVCSTASKVSAHRVRRNQPHC